MAPPIIDLRKTEDQRDVVHRAVQALAEGQLVAFPTETVYGVAGSALRADVVERLREAKLRPADSPFTLAIKSADDALDYVPGLPPLAARLARRCWPGPVTLVLDDDHPDSVVQQLPAPVRQAVVPNGSIGLRVPAHPLLLSVLRLSAGPLMLTSANVSGERDAVTAEEVVAALDDKVSLVLDDGRSKFAQPSSVVRVDDKGLQLLREGVINEKSLRRLASLMIVMVCTGNTCRSPMAALLMRHRLAQRLGCQIADLEDRGLMVLSAGIAAMNGEGASPEAVEAMKDRSLDLSDHVSQPLSERITRFADVILTMTRGHRDAICAQWPEATDRVHTLCGDVDVSDPIGAPSHVYQQCADQIESQIERWIAQLDLENLVAPHDASGD